MNRISAMPTNITSAFSHWDSFDSSGRTQESNVKTRLADVSSVSEVSVSTSGDTVELFERVETVRKNTVRFNPYGNSADARLARAGVTAKAAPASNASFTPTIMPWHDDWVAAGEPEYGSIAWNNFIDNWNIAKGHNVSKNDDFWLKMKPDPTDNLFPSVTEEEPTDADASTLASDAELSRLERGEISVSDYMSAFSGLTP